VALILVFVGAKMVASAWVHVPIVVSLVVILLTLSGAVGLSLIRSAREARTAA
jgi:predicted tellurium resistance membrane protein TerC